MRMFKSIVSGALSAALLCTGGAASATDTMETAEQLRRLDIMLMVTSLRCRNGADNFQADYNRFSAAHLARMNGASRQLKASLEKKHGVKGAARQLDRISVSMANDYGNGHPWLGCGELRQVTRELANEKNPGRLVAAADELLSTQPKGQLARLARR